MSKPIIIRRPAEADVHIAYETLDQVRAGFGKAFTRQVRTVLERIELFPEMYGVIWRDVRAARVRRFR